MVITLCKILSKSPSGIVYNSEDGRKTHESLGFSRKNAVEILNGVDIGNRILDANSESLRTTLGKQRDTPIVAHIGRFHPKKDHQTLLQAFSRVSRAMPHVRFVLVGSNVDYANSELADTINRLTLSGVCHLLGEREDVDQILEETDVLVSSSSWGEGFPNVIAEAMSQGVLCVATDVGEARNIIGNAGFIVRPKKPLELATQIMTALNLSRAKRREISQCAVDRIQEKFSIEKSSSAYMELYENLASFRESFR